MKKSLAFVLGVLLTVNFAFAEDTVAAPVAYCEHMGYKIDINNDTNDLECVFDSNNKTNATAFYNHACCQDKVRIISPRKEGETVYPEFEKCEEGLIISEPAYLLELPTCQKPSFVNFFVNWLRSIL